MLASVPVLVLLICIVIIQTDRSSASSSMTPAGCIKNCDEWHIVIAILISRLADAEDFDDVKAFVLNSVIGCCEKYEGKIHVNIINPQTGGPSGWCQDSDCVQTILDGINYETSAVPVEQMSKNDTETKDAAKAGRALLNPQLLVDDGRIPELLLITNYISQPFARSYDRFLELRTNLSQVHFRMFIIGAPIDYYWYNSSLSNADLEFFKSFSDLAMADGRLCDVPEEPVFKDVAIILVSIAIGFMIVQGLVVSIFLCYKNKRINRKNKILHFSVYQRSSMNMRPITPTTSSPHIPLLMHIIDGGADANDTNATTTYQYNRDRWEIKVDKLVIDRNVKLGIGANGEVYKGLLIGKAPIIHCNKSSFGFRSRFCDCEVAVKMIPAYADSNRKANFLNEITVMKHIDFHPHIVNMLGCITTGPSVCLVMEYAPNGDLAQWLQSRRGLLSSNTSEYLDRSKGELCIRNLLAFAWQITEGMVFLAAKGFVHRDLAARNILIDKSLKAMISDFGLCLSPHTQLPDRSRRDRLPIKWMPIEALKQFEFSTKTDVWSFGVVLYEILTMGDTPYDGMHAQDMIAHLSAGNRLPRPKFASSQMYDVMMSCWRDQPDERPTFNGLRETLAHFLEEETETYGYLDLSHIRAFDGSVTPKSSDAGCIESA